MDRIIHMQQAGTQKGAWQIVTAGISFVWGVGAICHLSLLSDQSHAQEFRAVPPAVPNSQSRDEQIHVSRQYAAEYSAQLDAARRRLSDISSEDATECMESIRSAFRQTLPDELLLETHVVLGQLAARSEDFGSAMQYFAQAAKLVKDAKKENSKLSSRYFELGEALQRIGYYRPALRCYEEAQAIEVNSSLVDQCLLNQGLLLLELGDKEEAAELLRRIPPRADGQRYPPYYILKNGLRVFNGEASAAVEQLGVVDSPLNEVCRSHPDFHWVMSRAHMALGQFDEALVHAQALEARKDSLFAGAPAMLLQAQALQQQGSTSQAMDKLRSIHDKPFHLVASVAADRLAATLHRQQGEFREALELSEKVFETAAEHQNNLLVIEGKVSPRDVTLRSEMQKQELLNDQIREENQNLVQENDVAWRAFGIAIGLMFVVAAAICFQLTLSELRKEKRLKKLQQKHNSALVEVVNQTSEALTREVTERVELEKSLERKRRDEAIGKLTGNVAHDFNNLLQVIISTNEHLRAKALPYSEFDRELIATSTKSAQTGASIVRQLLAYARQQVLAPQSIPLDRYFEGTSDLLKAAVTRPSVLELENQCGELRIKVDPTQLTTSLINLLANALDAMPNGGKVRLAARPFGSMPNDSKEWKLDDFKEYLLIEVIDEGKGLTAEEKKHVFEPFYSTKPTATGTGLGLSSVLGFVHQSGGDISIFDNAEAGLRVAMVFPVSTEQSIFTEETTEGIAPVGGKVLIVEDNSYVAYSVQNDLEQLGFETHWVDNGRDAIELFIDEFVFDAVVSDVRMPGDVSGIELRDWIRQNYPETAFVLMSGYSYVDTHPERSAFLQKPFTPIEMLQAIHSELQERHVTQAAPKECVVKKK